MNKITEKCTGCRACEQICKKNAISMVLDHEGFYVPAINFNVCVNCGLCAKICPQNNLVKKNYPLKTIGLKLKDRNEINKCASGGVFTGLAQTILNEKGIVVGVGYDEGFNAKHYVLDNIKDLAIIQSSKYVQADTNSVYSEIKNKLEIGKKVLFSGTGCQVAGLKQYLRKDYDNLITVDLICHGVTSPLMFQRYIRWEEKKIRGTLKSFNFRSKNHGWGLIYTFTFISKGRLHTKSDVCYNNVYYKHFLAGDAYRECCYDCRYCTPERCSDITIGDFWGIDKVHPKFYSSKGVSCTLVNTQKGQDLLSRAIDKFDSIETTLNNISIRNANLVKPTQRDSSIRDHIYKGIHNETWFKELVLKDKKSLKNIIKCFIPLEIRMLIVKLKTKIKILL